MNINRVTNETNDLEDIKPLDYNSKRNDETSDDLDYIDLEQLARDISDVSGNDYDY